MFEVLRKVDKAHDEGIWSVAWRRNCIVTGSADGKIKCWNEQLEKRFEHDASPLGVVSVDMETFGALAVSCTMDSHLKVYDLDDQSTTFGHVIGDFSAGALESWATRFSSNYGREGKIPQIATTTQSGAVHIWQVEESGDQSAHNKLKATRDKSQTLQATSHKFAMSLDWSRSRDLIATGGVDGVVSIFSLKGVKPHSVTAHMMPVRSVSFASDDKTVLSASDDMTVNVLDTETGKSIGLLTGHSSAVLAVHHHPSKPLVATGGNDNKVKIWDLTSLECITTLSKHEDSVWDVKWHDKGQQLVSVSEDRAVIIYNTLGDK